MNWSPQQSRAIDDVGAWLKSDRQVFRLFGYAGTGKSTLARHLGELASGHVHFGAYTGKAASVIRKKGSPGASTIHRLIYQPSEKSRKGLNEIVDTLIAKRKQVKPGERGSKARLLADEITRLENLARIERDAVRQPGFRLNPDSVLSVRRGLVIIDECSMVGKVMGADLLSFGCKVLVLGDPAQLPPVKSGGFFTNARPDVMLTEIHRQAEGSPIIDLATKVRRGETLELGEYDGSVVMKGKPDPADVLACDQLLVGRNSTRKTCNRNARKRLGLAETAEPSLPVAGDRLVCLRNDHDEGLLNGELWNVQACDSVDGLDRIALRIDNEDDGRELAVEAHPHHVLDRERELPHYELRDAQCFDYGYALTVHKAQGSQWPSVFVFQDSFHGNRRWLYTAITRAAERVIVCER